MKPFNLKEYLKNPMKVITRDGRNARIVCVDAQGDYPVVALITEVEGEYKHESPEMYTEDGLNYYGQQTSIDLFFAPEKKVGWANIYRGKDEPVIGHIFNSEEEARESSRHCNSYTKDLYLGTAKIEWEEE